MSFDSLNLHPSLARAVRDLGFEQPTDIQRDAIPAALAGRDVLACASTGSGKTAAFVLPILQRLLEQPRPGGRATRALVLVPTRELAAQIVEHARALARHTRLEAAAVYGGVGMGDQEKALRRGADLVVACPGRLLDHMQYAYARFPALQVLVLDEADRMLDMGFLPDIRRVLAALPKAEQTMLFSATIHPVADLARTLLRNPASFNLERKAVPAAGIEQAVFPVRQDLKSPLLLALLRSNTLDQALVFTRTKHRANRLALFLAKHGVASERIHGNRSQAQRTQALAGFKSGRYRVLVATDVAARGIDIEALSHVVNFDVPLVPEDYIHRVGRTARAGQTGEAFTLVAPEEQNELRAIERAVKATLRRRTLDGFDYQAGRAEALEIPLGQRLDEMRGRRRGERDRAHAKQARRPVEPARQRPAEQARQRAAEHRPAASHGQAPRAAAPPVRRPSGASGRPATRRRVRRAGW